MKGIVSSLVALCISAISINSYAINCDAIPQWVSSAVYTKDMQVQQSQKVYKANWWTQNHSPANYSGPWQEWTYQGDCVAVNHPPVAVLTVSQPSSSAHTSYPVSYSYILSGSSSYDIDGDPITYSWDGINFTNDPITSIYSGGFYDLCEDRYVTITLTVKDSHGEISTASQSVKIGDASPGNPACSSSSRSSISSITTTSVSSSSVPSVASSTSVSSVSSVNNDLPKHALVGYWHNFDNGSGVIRVADVDSAWDVIVVAFADDVGNGSVAFNLDPVFNKAQFIADIAAKRSQGKKVVLSFGGQNGTVTLNTATHVTNFVNSTAAIMNEYGFDGIDIDLESGANVAWDAPVIGNIVTAVKQLKQLFPDLYLSMAPEHPYVQGGMIAATGIWGAYLPIIDGLRDELTLLHVQLYNNGSLATPYSSQPLQAGTVDFMVASIKMLVEGFTLANNTWFTGLRPDQVALGVPSGSRAAGSGFVAIAELNNAVNCLVKLTGCGTITPNQAYPDFRGVMTWSINWDVADGRPFSVPVKANLDTLP